MNKPRLFLFVGYPGAGKTTVSKIIEETTGAVHIWADQERKKMFGEPTHSHNESHKLYSRLNDETAKMLESGKSVIFDTNFNFFKDREHMRHIASRHGAEAIIVWITTPAELACKRAVYESEGQHTRLYGNMTQETWNRIANHLEPPTESEKVIKIDGTQVDPEEVKRLLSL